MCFGRELEPSLPRTEVGGRLRLSHRRAISSGDEDAFYAYCWVCSRQHHSACVGQATFICGGCQRRTQERCVGAGNAGLNVVNVVNAASVGVVPSQVGGVVGAFASPGGVAGSGVGGSGGGGVVYTRSGRRSGVAVI